MGVRLELEANEVNMSAKADRMQRLVYILERTTSWVSSGVLAKMLGTSERTVRNYIAELNETGTLRIDSSKDGYRAAPQHAGIAAKPQETSRTDAPEPSVPAPAEVHPQKSTAEKRRDVVLSRLINASEPISVFDLADELAISESTLQNTVLPQVRKLISPFSLHLSNHDFKLELTGTESNKRKMLGHIAIQNANGYFTSAATLQEMFPSFDIKSILNKLVQICQRSELLINNYALNNLLVHVLVIVVRLQSNNELGEHAHLIDAERLVRTFRQGDAILRCADAISHYFEDEFSCSMPESDFQQITLLIALSVERYSYDELSFDNLARLMDRSFVDAVANIAAQTFTRYGIGRLDEAFLLQLTLHMYNVYQRAVYHVSYPNPLAGQIKSEYAPVYDMAVYFAHQFSQRFGISVSENEIAFIAFHIGAYLERSSTPDDKATGVVIVEEYHDFARQLVDDLEAALSDELAIIGVMSCEAYLASHPTCDVVITTIDVPVTHGTKILIGPILTSQNLRKLRDKLADVLEAKRRRHAYAFLKRALRPDLFIRNMYLQGDMDAYIDYLGSLCQAHGLATAEFIRDVHLRERVSSTAFTDCLAIPHSIDTYAAQSFIAVLHNDTAIPWGRHDVNFVLLIGIAREDMGFFRDALDIIIELFSSVDDTMRLMQTDTFEEFVRVFTHELR